MNLFQSVLQAMSDDIVEIKDIATFAQKSVKSVEGEIGRLKQTSWIQGWISYDKNTGRVRLVKSLRGIGFQPLEYMIKQFYAADRKAGKQFDSKYGPKVSYDGMSSFVNQVDNYLNKQYKEVEKENNKIGILNV